MCTYFFGYTLGVGSMIWVLIGEMRPAKICGLTSGVAVTMAYVGMTSSAYATNFVIEAYGMGVTFLGYAVICVLHSLFSFKYLPETKDMSEKEKHDIYQ